MKYKTGSYVQLDKKIFSEEYASMSVGAKWLYTYLTGLEHRFCTEDKNYFFRTDEQLSKDVGISLNSLKKYKRELKEVGLIQINYGHYVDRKTGKKSQEKYTAYTIL